MERTDRYGVGFSVGRNYIFWQECYCVPESRTFSSFEAAEKYARERLVEILRDIFGNRLKIPPLNYYEGQENPVEGRNFWVRRGLFGIQGFYGYSIKKVRG